MQLTLVRTHASPRGAFGVLSVDGESEPFAVTIEHTYVMPGSDAAVKIPAGLYSCTRRMFFKGGYETFEIAVPGHTDILFHKANYASDVDGCIGVGLSFNEFGPADTNPGIANSAD